MLKRERVRERERETEMCAVKETSCIADRFLRAEMTAAETITVTMTTSASSARAVMITNVRSVHNNNVTT